MTRKEIHKSDYKDSNFNVTARSGILDVELTYPYLTEEYPDRCTEVEVNLMDTRSTDGVRIRYDHDRAGWVITQEVWFETLEPEMSLDSGTWLEVAFVPNWGSVRQMTQEQSEHWYKTSELPKVETEDC